MQEQRSLSWRLSWYRQSELEGALLLGRLIRRVTDAYLVTRLTRHCADEARHSWLWAQTLESLGLSAVAIRRSYQSFYLDQIGPPRSVIDVLALTHVFEQRVHRHFRDELSHPDVPAAARTTFGRLLRDEQQHLDWVGRWLAAQSASPALLSRYRDVDEQVARRLAPYRDRLWDVEGLERSSLMSAMANAGRRRRNATRHSRSIAGKLLREGPFHLIPLYYLLRLSDLGREGIEHSGSFRFADHIYRGLPSGRTPLGHWIDARLLAMPAAQAFRRRCQRAQRVISAGLEELPPGRETLRILAVPCGIPRDLIDLMGTLRHEQPCLLSRIQYHGMDIDHRAIAIASRLTAACGAAAVGYHLGDALKRHDYPDSTFDLVVSTGLGEFLSDCELERFYANVYDVLEPGGTFYTSATALDRRSNVLLRMAELLAIYREPGRLERILRTCPWKRLVLTPDPTGLQTFVTAIK